MWSSCLLTLQSHSKQRVLDILSECFRDDKSVNSVIKMDSKAQKRRRILLEYSYFLVEQFGKIYQSEDGLACALVLYPEKVQMSLKRIFWEIKLVFQSMTLPRLLSVVRRQRYLKSFHPPQPHHYLWYLGVSNKAQGQGHGGKLLEIIYDDAKKAGKDLFLISSNQQSFSFYERHGFTCIKKVENLEFPIHFYCKFC